MSPLSGARAVADAVVPGQVRRGLRGGDQVVAGHPELDGARQGRLPHLGAELAAELDCSLHRVVDAGLDALGLVQLLRHADAQALEVLGLGELDRLRQVDGRRVQRVAAGDDPVEERRVADRLRERADLVEAGREGDDPVARHRPVRGPEADEAAERRRLLDRAAGVGAERPGGETRLRRRLPSRRRSRRARGLDPTGSASGRTPSSRSTSPSRTRPCSSCRSSAVPLPCSGPQRSSRRPVCSRRGSWSRRSSRRPSSRSRP